MRLIKKICFAVSVLSGVFMLMFLLFFILGDPAEMIAGQNADKKTKDAIRQEMGLNETMSKRLLLLANDWSPISYYPKAALKQKKIDGIVLGDEKCWVIKLPYMGISYQTRRPVADMLGEAIPSTILLALSALLIAVIVGVPLGMWAALKKGSIMDSAILSISSVGISAPSFFISILVAFIFGIVWHQYTGLDFMGSMYEYHPATGEKELALAHLVLPCLSLSIRPLAIIVQMTRSSVLEIAQMDFIKTVKAKGCSRSRLNWVHVLPNSLNPVITSITGWLAELLAGSFFVEYIFGWQGMGMLTIGALEKLDLPLLFSSVMVSASMFILITAITDWMYKMVDSRVR